MVGLERRSNDVEDEPVVVALEGDIPVVVSLVVLLAELVTFDSLDRRKRHQGCTKESKKEEKSLHNL